MSKIDKDKVRTNTHLYLKYSGLAFQIAGVVVGGYFLGDYIDRQLEMDKPIFAALLALIFMIGIFYKVYKDLV